MTKDRLSTSSQVSGANADAFEYQFSCTISCERATKGTMSTLANSESLCFRWYLSYVGRRMAAFVSIYPGEEMA